jgi:uncharacterized protein (DUF2235 family)
MSKALVVCCDGTGNQPEGDLSNVLKLYRITVKDLSQRVYYDPGVGTLGHRDEWTRIKQNAKAVFGLATGYGLDDNVLDAYRFIAENFEDGDDIFLLGFSRGAYTVRVLAGFLHLIGLLYPDQLNLVGYALTAYKQASEKSDFRIAWDFRRVTGGRAVPIKFLGVWDTVASVMVPRRDRFFVPSLLALPYTRTNPSVAIFRHAVAIDETRRMFRLNSWIEPQLYRPNPFGSEPAPLQDIKQVWFAGVHADIGGGYPESESALSKFPLDWMVGEAKAAGLRINTAMRNHLVRGLPRAGGTRIYVKPDAAGQLHQSLTVGWRVLEWLPKSSALREWPADASKQAWYLPRGEPRLIPEGARLHSSVMLRLQSSNYRPRNLPDQYIVEGEAIRADDAPEN